MRLGISGPLSVLAQLRDIESASVEVWDGMESKNSQNYIKAEQDMKYQLTCEEIFIDFNNKNGEKCEELQ